jgi:hypothetical protein
MDVRHPSRPQRASLEGSPTNARPTAAKRERPTDPFCACFWGWSRLGSVVGAARGARYPPVNGVRAGFAALVYGWWSHAIGVSFGFWCARTRVLVSWPGVPTAAAACRGRVPPCEAWRVLSGSGQVRVAGFGAALPSWRRILTIPFMYRSGACLAPDGSAWGG